MHHRPASRSLPARLALGLSLTAVLSFVVVAVPVVSGAGTANTPVALESSSATSERSTPTPNGESPVIMGQDGLRAGAAPAPGTTPGSPSPTSSPVPTPQEAQEAQGDQAEDTPSNASPDTSPAPSATTLPGTSAPGTPSSTPPTAEPASATAAGLADQVVALVNTERAAAGCAAVASDGALAEVARAHSEDMRDRGFFDHVNPDGLSPFDRAERAGLSARAENIARGQADAAAVMTSWMNSPGHRATILDCSLTRLGVGVAEGDGGPWWTQLFA